MHEVQAIILGLSALIGYPVMLAIIYKIAGSTGTDKNDSPWMKF